MAEDEHAGAWSTVEGSFKIASQAIETTIVALIETQWLLVILLLLVCLWCLRGRWAGPCLAAYERLQLPDPRDFSCVCFSCGWLISNVLCPFVCPKFHPPFRLRMIILKAKKLRVDSVSHTAGFLDVYAQVTTGKNPGKTTSLQRYVLERPGSADGSVTWNEPLDVVMDPSDNLVHIELNRKDKSSEACIGSVSLPASAIFESAGCFGDFPCCGFYCWPRFCSLFGCEYRWPFVRGAPTWREARDRYRAARPCLWWCCIPRFFMEDTEAREAMLSAPQLSIEEQARSDALQLVKEDGLQLQQLPYDFQNDREVVLEAVKQNGEALRFASPALQSDPELQRESAEVPKPLVLQLHYKGKYAGLLWAYFIIHGLNQEDDLPSHFFADV